jgi:hypothetical protein
MKFPIREGGAPVDKIFLLAGIAGTIGGVGLLVYQGLIYLMHNNWIQYTLFTVVENGPDFLWNAVAMSPGVVNALKGCPLFAALIVLGLILLVISSRLRNRYA